MNRPNVVPIDARDDPRLSPYTNLRSIHAQSEYFIAEGRIPVKRLIASPYPVDSLLVQRGHESEFADVVPSATPIYSLPSERLKSVVGFDFHRGVMACGRRPDIPMMDRFRFAETDVPLALALIGVTELENVGSILRSAAAFGVRHVLLGPGTADPFSRRVIRVSMANVFSLNLYRTTEPASDLGRIGEKLGMRTVAATLGADATPLDHFALDGRPLLLVIGNEAVGLDREVIAAVTDEVTVPMMLGTDSLNVAVATAIFMYRLTSGRI